MHGGNTEICQNQIGTGELFGDQHFGQARKITAVHGEHVWSKVEGAQAGFGLGQLNGINIQSEESATRLNFLEDLPRMTAVAKRAIDNDCPRLGIEHLENLGHHDGPVCASGRLAGCDHLRNGFGIKRRIMLLVLIRKPARIFTGIPGPAFVRSGRGGG